jgi:excisionase family DNA binding protein
MYLTINEFAKLKGVKPTTVYVWIRRGKIKKEDLQIVVSEGKNYKISSEAKILEKKFS